MQKPETPIQTTTKPHWTVHYREWVATRPDIAKLGLIEQMEAYMEVFPEAENNLR